MRSYRLAAELMNSFGLEDPVTGFREEYWEEVCDAEWAQN